MFVWCITCASPDIASGKGKGERGRRRRRGGAGKRDGEREEEAEVDAKLTRGRSSCVWGEVQLRREWEHLCVDLAVMLNATAHNGAATALEALQTPLALLPSSGLLRRLEASLALSAAPPDLPRATLALQQAQAAERKRE
eukprot:1450124-Rhodomonas_salina.1